MPNIGLDVHSARNPTFHGELWPIYSSSAQSGILNGRFVLNLAIAVLPVQPTKQQQQQADDSAATATMEKPAHPCPCCGSAMIIIETFQAGSVPRHRPSAPVLEIGIDTS